MTIASTMKRVLVGGFFFFLLVAVPRAAIAAPTCSTFDEHNRPAVNFAAADELAVRANGLKARSPVVVTFSQGPRNVEIARGTATDLGAFTTDPSKTRIPESVGAGAATIKVLQGSGSASCDITLVASAPPKSRGLSQRSYIAWGSAIGLGAIALVILQIRRWQAEKLEEEIDSIGRKGPDEIVAKLLPAEGADDAPLEFVGLEPHETTVVAGVAADDEDERPLLDDDGEREPQPDEPPAKAPVPPEPAAAEASDAVTRLQAEVRAWRSR